MLDLDASSRNLWRDESAHDGAMFTGLTDAITGALDGSSSSGSGATDNGG